MPRQRNKKTSGGQEVVKRLSKERLDNLYALVQRAYLADGRPWIIGYSGGKDSTCVLQIIWHALSQLSEEQRFKTVFVISSDTLVEMPAIVNHLDKTLKQINDAAQMHSMPFESHKVVPASDNTFWVNLIGRGYPAPSTWFRWCTDRMKIEPASRFIIDKVKAHGEVIIALGARKDESASRRQVIEKKKSKGECLSRHGNLPNAWVFTPIEDWSTNDVWEYLLNTPSPWGGRNRSLVTMYRNAQSGECPLVIDKTTPSCGSGRFGCWTCTVVKKDSSMEAMIDKGEEWLEPLLEFRDWLASTQDPAEKRKLRDYRRRNGNVQYRDDNGVKKLIHGPYYLEVRMDILRRLLKVQKKIRETGPNPNESLISASELAKIRQLWRFEEGDWEDNLPKIYREETGEDLEILDDDWSGMGGVEYQVLKEVCGHFSLDIRRVTELFDAEKKCYGMNRRAGIHSEIAAILKKDWRSREEVPLELT